MTRELDGKPVRSTKTKNEAINAVHATARTIYGRLFDWLVLRINNVVNIEDQDTKPWLAILDIFGFEVFSVNSLEQLLINYVNEKLQGYFIEFTFKEEQRLFEDE